MLVQTSPSSRNIRQSEYSIQDVVPVEDGDAVSPTLPPTNNLGGAFQSLRDWLSTEAIRRVLEVCTNSSYRILDGAYLSATFLDQKDKPLIRLKPHERSVIAPIYYHNHWILAISALDEKRICHYDSLRLPSDRMESVTLAFTKRLNSVNEWQFDDRDWPRQTNESDCGINTLVTAWYWMADLEAPRTVNCQVWRFVFVVLLQPESKQNI